MERYLHTSLMNCLLMVITIEQNLHQKNMTTSKDADFMPPDI